MKTLSIREELHNFVDKGNEDILRIFYAMVMEYKKVGTKTLSVFSKNEFIDDIKEAERQIKEGDFQTIENFEKEANQW